MYLLTKSEILASDVSVSLSGVTDASKVIDGSIGSYVETATLALLGVIARLQLEKLYQHDRMSLPPTPMTKPQYPQYSFFTSPQASQSRLIALALIIK